MQERCQSNAVKSFLCCLFNLFPNYKIELQLDSIEGYMKEEMEKFKFDEKRGVSFFRSLMNVIEASNFFILLALLALPKASSKIRKLSPISVIFNLNCSRPFSSNALIS
jgi:uncharacterized FlgJ-related protein